MRFFAETKRTTHNTLIRHVSSSGFVFPAITCAISSRCGGRRDAPRATVRLQEYESPRVLQPALQKAADAFGEKDEVHFGQVNGYKEKAIQTRYEVKGHPSFKVTLLADSLSFSPRSALGQRLPPPLCAHLLSGSPKAARMRRPFTSSTTRVDTKIRSSKWRVGTLIPCPPTCRRSGSLTRVFSMHLF